MAAARRPLVAPALAAVCCALGAVTLVPGPAAAQPTVREVLGVEAGGGAGADAAPAEGETQEVAQAGTDAVAEEAETAAVPGATPRSAVLSFMEAAAHDDFATAAQFLDTRALSGPARDVEPELLARQLARVLSQSWWIDPETLSSDPQGRREAGLPPGREEVQRIEASEGDVPILLQRGTTPDGERIWRFAAPTVSRVPALYQEFGRNPLAAWLPSWAVDWIPEWALDWRLFGLQLWQWIGLFTLLVLTAFLSWIAASLAHSVVQGVLRHRREQALEVIESFIRGPLRLAIGVLIFTVGQTLLEPSVVLRTVLFAIEQTLLIVAVTWAFLRLADVGVEMVKRRLVERNQSQVVSLLPPGRKTLKALILVLAVLVTLDNFGFDVTALIAGLGVGGIAVALAAQRTVENLFGGVSIYADRPVRVGDFCRFGDKVGTVEEIGLRSTRIRTLDRTLVSVPNAEFSNLQLENFSARDQIWYHPTVSLRYETTPDQLRYVLVEVRRMLYAHPKVHPDPARIRFTKFGAYSLDLDVFAYVLTQDFGEYLEIAEDLNLRIMDIVARAGTSFAFPSQTTYLEQGESLSPERREEIEAQVAQWREQQALYVPRFPRAEIEKLDDTLDYPNEGAPHLDAQGNPVRKG